jgi:hypothetical protein
MDVQISMEFSGDQMDLVASHEPTIAYDPTLLQFD